MQSRRRPLLIALGVAVAAWALYAPALTADFVWDARSKVLISPFIHEAGNFWDVATGRVITRDVLDNNRPGMLLSLMMDAALWGKSPPGYHATSVTLHAAVCALLFLLLLRLAGGCRAALGGAAVFAAHPLNCEPVSEVSYREDLLVAASILVALFAAMRFLRKPGAWRNGLLGALCVGALLYGVSAKENGVAGPVVIAGYWLLWRRGEARGPWALLVAGGALAVGGFLAARFTLRPAHSIIFPTPPPRLAGTMCGVLAMQVRIWTMQFTQMLAPRDLCADYTGWSVRGYASGISVAVVGIVVALQVWHATRSRVAALGWLWFWAGLLPVANLLPLYRPMADRFLYVPILGAALALGHGLECASRLRSAVARAWIASVVAAWVILAGAITFRREAVWHDGLALWRDTAAANPMSPTAANNLGWELVHAGRPREALDAFRRAVDLSGGRDPDPWAGAALALDAMGHLPGARHALECAVALDARYARPRELVRALTMEEDVAGKLEVLLDRIKSP